MNKYTLILLMLCLLAFIVPVNASIMTFETMEGFTTGTLYNVSGDWVYKPASNAFSTREITIPTNGTISANIYAPEGMPKDNLAFQVKTANKVFVVSSGSPNADKWGVLNGASYVDTGFYIDYGIWRNLKFVIRGNTASVYVDNTLIYSDSTGTSGTYTPSIVFYQATTYYYVDDISIHDDDLGTQYDVTVSIESGTGTANLKKNGALLGSASTVSSFTDSSFVEGDVYLVEPIPATGYNLSKYCLDLACNVEYATLPITDTIYASGAHIYVYFAQTVIPTLLVEKVSGSGSITIKKNGAYYNTLVTSESAILLEYNIDDSYTLTAVPSSGYQFDGYCIELLDCTNKISTNPYTNTIINNDMDAYAYFSLIPTPTPTASPSPSPTATVSPTPTVSPTVTATPQPTPNPNSSNQVSFYVTQVDATISITEGETKQVNLYPTNATCDNQEFIISKSGYYSYRDKCFSNSYHISLTPTGLGKAYIGDIIDPYIWIQGITTQANGSKQVIIAVKRDLSFPEYDVQYTFDDHSINRLPMAEITGYYNVSDKLFSVNSIGSNYITFNMSNTEICDPNANKAAYLCDGSNLPAGPTNPGNPPGYNPMQEKTDDLLSSGFFVGFIMLMIFAGAGAMIGGPIGATLGFSSGMIFTAFYGLIPTWGLFLFAIIGITAFAVMFSDKITGGTG